MLLPTRTPVPFPMTNSQAVTRAKVSASALVLAGLALLLHAVVGLETPYGFHRDEFLYIAMGTHLRILHMDFPPMIALLSNVVRALAGSSLFAYRMVPALFGTGLLVLAVSTARAMGGGPTAQVLTAIAVLFNPLFLRAATLFQPVVLDQFWWMLGFYALVRLGHADERRWWLLLGVAGGLGLLSKFSILFFGLSVLIGLLISRRRALVTAGPWMALGVALLLGAPSIIGQVALGWPLFDQMAGLRQGQLGRITLGGYVLEQLTWGPVSFALAVAGATALLRRPSLQRFRVTGWAAVAAFILYAITRGKPYYVGPIYPMLFAAGGVWVEQIARPKVRAGLAWGAATLIVVTGVLALPFGVPFLAPASMARYAAASGVSSGVQTNRGVLLSLPQDYADMLGWREKAEAVAAVYAKLPAAERAEAVIYASNYGQAGSLEFYGRELRLPPVVSLAGSFYLFGPGTRPGRTIILVGVPREKVRGISCETLDDAGRVGNRWGVPEERDVPILLCRHPNLTLQELWRARGPQWG